MSWPSRALRRPRASARSEEAALPDARGALQALEPRAGRKSAVAELGDRHGFEVTTLEGYKQDSDRARPVDHHAGIPRAVRRRDADDERQPAAARPLRSRRSSITCAMAMALVGVHCATLTLYDYPEFGRVARRLLPALDRADRANRRAPRRRPQGRGSESHPATKMLGGSWPIVEEFYQFGTAVWDATPALRERRARSDASRFRWRSRATASTCSSASTPRRPTSAISGPEIRKGGDYPQAWTRTDGRGRVVLHRARTPRRHLVERSRVSSACGRRHPVGAVARARSRYGFRNEPEDLSLVAVGQHVERAVRALADAADPAR